MFGFQIVLRNLFFLQKIIDYLFSRGKAFQLVKPIRLTNLDCSRGEALDAQIQVAIDDVTKLAVEQKDVHLVEFVHSLAGTDKDVQVEAVDDGVELPAPLGADVAGGPALNSESDTLVNIRYEEYVTAHYVPESDKYTFVRESLIADEWKSVKVQWNAEIRTSAKLQNLD